MQVIKDTKDISLTDISAVAIGKFDGIHLGHKVLIDDLRSRSAEGMKTVIFSFNPPPSEFFGAGESLCLTTFEEKCRIFEKLGVDIYVEYPFDRETADMSPEAFVEDILVRRLNMRYVAAGEDVSYGRDGRGDAALLESLGDRLGYGVSIHSKLRIDGGPVSSSRIRRLVTAGEMERAGSLIGDFYSISGKVVRGRQLGTSMGFPTINLVPDKRKLLPRGGVYYSALSYAGCYHIAMTNIGCRPTVSSEGEINIETFVLDFDECVYDKDVSVKFLKFKRPERKFGSVEELKVQLKEDFRHLNMFRQESFGRNTGFRV